MSDLGSGLFRYPRTRVQIQSSATFIEQYLTVWIRDENKELESGNAHFFRKKTLISYVISVGNILTLKNQAYFGMAQVYLLRIMKLSFIPSKFIKKRVDNKSICVKVWAQIDACLLTP